MRKAWILSPDHAWAQKALYCIAYANFPFCLGPRLSRLSPLSLASVFDRYDKCLKLESLYLNQFVFVHYGMSNRGNDLNAK